MAELSSQCELMPVKTTPRPAPIAIETPVAAAPSGSAWTHSAADCSERRARSSVEERLDPKPTTLHPFGIVGDRFAGIVNDLAGFAGHIDDNTAGLGTGVAGRVPDRFTGVPGCFCGVVGGIYNIRGDLGGLPADISLIGLGLDRSAPFWAVS